MANALLRDAYESIAAWALAATSEDDKHFPDLAPLRKDLPKVRTRSIAYVGENVHEGRTVVAFEIKLEGSGGSKRRHVLPVHFALIRALEIVPGLNLLLADDPHRKQKAEKGFPDDKLIFRPKIRLTNKKIRVENKHKRQLGLDRILFNVGSTSKLIERRTGDYRFIVPSGYVPIRFDGDPLLVQENLLDIVGALIEGSSPALVPATAKEMIALLRSLFATADRWHWHELIDRIDGDSRHGSEPQSQPLS